MKSNFQKVFSLFFLVGFILLFAGKSHSADALDTCLQGLIDKHGAYDESNAEFQACYKEWVGTVDSPVKNFSIVYKSFGSFPCYTEQTVTITDQESTKSITQYNEDMPECMPSSQETTVVRDIPFSLMQVENTRSLLNLEQIKAYKDEYVDSQLTDTQGSEWTFRINDAPAKHIIVNVESFSVLPKNLQILLSYLGSLIHPMAR